MLLASEKIQRIFMFCLFVLLVFGSKLWLIKHFGNATPFGDQWDAEAVLLYRPYLQGTLNFVDFFSAHNEHRIFFTRILDLGLLNLNGLWDPLLQMLINAALHCISLVVLLVILCRQLPIIQAACLVIFSSLICVIPFGWENTLWGFQSQVYFLILFSVLSVSMLCLYEVWSGGWWLGYICGIASYFSFASGALSLISVAAIYTLQILMSNRDKSNWIVIGGFILTTALFLYYIPKIDRHASIQAHSATDFIGAFANTTEWPTKRLGGILLHLPIGIVFISLIKSRSPKNDYGWLILGLSLWMFMQYASISFGRASNGVTQSRYRDIFILATIINMSALIYLLSKPKRSSIIYWLLGIWILLVAQGLTHTIKKIPPEIIERKNSAMVQQANISHYLASQDFSWLNDKSTLEISYPSPQGLQRILAMPETQCILPSILYDSEKSIINSAEGRRITSNGNIEKIYKAVLFYGWLLVPICSVLMIIIQIHIFWKSLRKETTHLHLRF